MMTVGQLHEFCPESKSLTMYIEQVEQFSITNDIASQKKIPVFLSAVEGTMYGLLRNLLAPTSPQNKLFDEMVEVLKAHFEPKPVVITKCFHFHRCDQAPTETVAVHVYAAELRQQATTCDLRKFLDQALWDHFVHAQKQDYKDELIVGSGIGESGAGYGGCAQEHADTEGTRTDSGSSGEGYTCRKTAVQWKKA